MPDGCPYCRSTRYRDDDEARECENCGARFPYDAAGTSNEVILAALQTIAFNDAMQPKEIALDALHAAGFASLKDGAS